MLISITEIGDIECKIWKLHASNANPRFFLLKGTNVFVIRNVQDVRLFMLLNVTYW